VHTFCSIFSDQGHIFSWVFAETNTPNTRLRHAYNELHKAQQFILQTKVQHEEPIRRQVLSSPPSFTLFTT